MHKEAASAVFYTSPWGKHARLQRITIQVLLTGKTIDRPAAHEHDVQAGTEGGDEESRSQAARF